MRLVNLAHGDLAVLGAFFCASVSDGLGWNPLVSLVIVLPAAFALGFVLDKAIFDRIVGVDPAYQIVATFGLAVVIQNLLLERYTANQRRLDVGAIERESIRISDDIAIGWMPLITFLVAVGVLVALSLFLHRTQTGRAFRATSDDTEAARLMGIDNKRIYASALGISVATAALAGVFLGIKTQFDPSSGPIRLIFAFEAVIIGGLGSLWGTLAGGIILGVAQTVGEQYADGVGRADREHGVPRGAGPAPDRLLRQGGRVMSVVAPPSASSSDARAFRVQRATTTSRVFAGVAVAAVVVLALLPQWGDDSLKQKMVVLFVYVALAQMWNLLAGYSGLVSIGQQAFFGLGAYGLIYFANNQNQDIYFAVLPAMLAAMVISVPVALLAFRLRGGYFAIGTWVIAEVIAGLVAKCGRGRCRPRRLARRGRLRRGRTSRRGLLAGAGARRRLGRCWSTACCGPGSGWRCRPSATTRAAPAASAPTSTGRASPSSCWPRSGPASRGPSTTSRT